MSTDSSRPPVPRTVFMFAGQGSQYLGMGAELYRNDSTFRDWMDYGSRCLEAQLGCSLATLVYRDGGDRFSGFDQTRLTHPAIFCVNYAVAQALLERGLRPDAVLGYSLGEIVAWTVAGSLRFEEALDIVVEMAVQIEERTPEGAMLAVIAPPGFAESRPELFLDVTRCCENYPGSFVVVGAPTSVATLQEELKAAGVAHQLLPIRRGFHSPLLAPVADTLRAAVRGVRVRPPALPIMSSMLAREVGVADFTPDHCWQVVREPVRFDAAFTALESAAPGRYVDCGPSGSLATFVRNLLGGRTNPRTFAVLTPFGRDQANLDALLRAFATTTAAGRTASAAATP